MLLSNFCLMITPLYICWEIWKGRCAAKYSSKRVSIARMKHTITHQIRQCLIRKKMPVEQVGSWQQLCSEVEKIRPLVTRRVVCWERPKRGRLKLNSDGSSSANTAGMGGVISEENGSFRLASFKRLNNCSNNKAEIEAALIGINLCIFYGWNNVDLEMDSLLIVKMVKKETAVPWEFVDQINELRTNLENLNGTISHCFREANFVADILAKHGAAVDFNHIPRLLYKFEDLPHLAKGYCTTDKAGMPSIRAKQTNQFHVLD